ncbi:MAG: type II secretion system F family protein [Beijerinckiaceae bacterium]
MDLNVLAFVAMAMLAVGGILYVFVYPLLSGDAKAEKRQAALSSVSPNRKVAERQTDAAARRKQVADSLKEVETRNKAKRFNIETRIVQAGLRWSRRRFLIFSGLCGVVSGVFMIMASNNMFLAVAMVGVGGLGFPLWFLNFRRNRRLKKFIEVFPEAIDIIVRGVRAGLPLGDCLRIVANEAAEPVRSEFRQIVETQTMGLPASEAVERLVVRVPIAEANFFSLVITIQQKAGGNLSEALSNLATVLRARKQMRGKIQAFSSEAKASAMIIGALPFAVGGMVYITSPKYIELLWTTSTGQVVLIGSAFWMAIGVFVMKSMINFEI